jgi:hypothetical protein
MENALDGYVFNMKEWRKASSLSHWGGKLRYIESVQIYTCAFIYQCLSFSQGSGTENYWIDDMCWLFSTLNKTMGGWLWKMMISIKGADLIEVIINCCETCSWTTTEVEINMQMVQSSLPVNKPLRHIIPYVKIFLSE